MLSSYSPSLVLRPSIVVPTPHDLTRPPYAKFPRPHTYPPLPTPLFSLVRKTGLKSPYTPSFTEVTSPDTTGVVSVGSKRLSFVCSPPPRPQMTTTWFGRFQCHFAGTLRTFPLTGPDLIPYLSFTYVPIRGSFGTNCVVFYPNFLKNPPKTCIFLMNSQ